MAGKVNVASTSRMVDDSDFISLSDIKRDEASELPSNRQCRSNDERQVTGKRKQDEGDPFLSPLLMGKKKKKKKKPEMAKRGDLMDFLSSLND